MRIRDSAEPYCINLQTVIECVPSIVAKAVTEAVKIPIIGIGAGPHTTGQVSFPQQARQSMNLLNNYINVDLTAEIALLFTSN